MFTGIVEEIGKVNGINKKEFDLDLLINARNLSQSLKIGDSVSVNGVCLTVRKISGIEFKVSAADETLRLTNLGALKNHDEVNLETSLTLMKPMGGHLVQGHITNSSVVSDCKAIGESLHITIKKPDGLDKYIVKKGYVAIDGISLTICEDYQNSFDVMIIPHTLDVTIAKNYKIGTRVNLEVDIFGRYIEKFYGRR